MWVNLRSTNLNGWSQIQSLFIWLLSKEKHVVTDEYREGTNHERARKYGAKTEMFSVVFSRWLCDCGCCHGGRIVRIRMLLLFLILTSVKLTLKLPLPFIICHCLSLEHKVDPFVFMVLKVEGRSLQEPQFLFHLNLTFHTKKLNMNENQKEMPRVRLQGHRERCPENGRWDEMGKGSMNGELRIDQVKHGKEGWAENSKLSFISDSPLEACLPLLSNQVH